MDGYALGKTKVFLKYFHLEYLSKLYERQMRKIIHVQVNLNVIKLFERILAESGEIFHGFFGGS